MPENKKDERKQGPLMTRFFHACLLLLGGVIALSLALHFMAQIWGWLVLIAGLAIAGYGVVRAIQWHRDRRW